VSDRELSRNLKMSQSKPGFGFAPHTQKKKPHPFWVKDECSDSFINPTQCLKIVTAFISSSFIGCCVKGERKSLRGVQIRLNVIQKRV